MFPSVVERIASGGGTETPNRIDPQVRDGIPVRVYRRRVTWAEQTLASPSGGTLSRGKNERSRRGSHT